MGENRGIIPLHPPANVTHSCAHALVTCQLRVLSWLLSYLSWVPISSYGRGPTPRHDIELVKSSSISQFGGIGFRKEGGGWGAVCMQRMVSMSSSTHTERVGTFTPWLEHLVQGHMERGRGG